VDEAAVLQLTRLPRLHRDPFDRMLVCQAIAGGMAILTPDREVAAYPVRTLW
jgi:PIN domain nuclease of toxin-antitoxin system